MGYHGLVTIWRRGFSHHMDQRQVSPAGSGRSYTVRATCVFYAFVPSFYFLLIVPVRPKLGISVDGAALRGGFKLVSALYAGWLRFACML